MATKYIKIRLNLDKEMDRRVYEYLDSCGGSLCRAAVSALYDHTQRLEEDAFLDRVIQTIRKESQKLKKQAVRAGISQAEFVRQKVFGLEPAPMLDNTFWNHMAELYAIHDRLKDESIKADLRRLILTIQSEATSPREVILHGNDEAVAH